MGNPKKEKSGAPHPQWFFSPEARIPPKYCDLIRQHGESFLDRPRSIRQLSADLGIARRTARVFAALLQGESVHSLKGLLPEEKLRGLSKQSKVEDLGVLFNPDGSVKSMPVFPRWDAATPKREGITIPELDPDVEDDEVFSIEQLITDRQEAFFRKQKRWQKKRVSIVPVSIAGPIAVAHFGDPHVDDDGCNWPELMRALRVVASTPGMYAGNIGDTTNNWPMAGRLARLWGQQGTTIPEAIRLARWLYRSAPWLYYVAGNHDKWNNGGDTLRYLTRGARISVLAKSVARIELRFPRGEPIRIIARHDFKGSSIWNRAHGAMRESKLNPWADIYVAGHRHLWTSHEEEGTDGRRRLAMIVRGFKHFDSYGENLQFHEHRHGHVGTTVLNPLAKSPMERVKLFWDIEAAADFLVWQRKKLGLEDLVQRDF